MSPIRITMGRTIGRARNVLSSSFAVFGFISATAALFALNLARADGGRTSISVLWALSVAPVLPALAAFLSMDAWSEERQTGRIDILLSTAVRERDLVLGKFLGVLTLACVIVAVTLAADVVTLRLFAPRALAGSSTLDFLFAFFGLAVQTVLWVAVSLAMSAFLRNSALAAGASILVLIVAPRGVWSGLLTCFGECRLGFSEMPFDAHAGDIASGMVSTGTAAFYLVTAGVFLFMTAKVVAALRFAGRNALRGRLSTWFSISLSAVLAVLAVRLADRLDFTIDVPMERSSLSLSARTRAILSETSGDLSVTCFLARDDVRFRMIGRLLRQFKEASKQVGGARFILQFVDPRWDIGAAERIVARGVTEESLIFEYGRRILVLPLRDGAGERACASTVRRLNSVQRRRTVCWTVGHGESRFDDYASFGMSDIARELARDGYVNRPLDLATTEPIPGDCALILVAGARNSFSRAERERLDAYLHEGGRLLVLTGSSQEEGAVSLLFSWGVRPGGNFGKSSTTLSGTDTIVSEFSNNHPITAPLKGSRVILENPVVFLPSALAQPGAGADRIEYTSLATSEGRIVALAVERGGGAGADLAIRPTRLVAIGDAAFAQNGSLALRAGANRDFFLNCIAYLSGTDVSPGDGDDSDVLTTGLNRRQRICHATVSSVLVPVLAFAVLAAMSIRRRRRS